MIIKDYQLHYYFIGRLLGKALYENLVLELPLASFFLCKILSGGMCLFNCLGHLMNVHIGVKPPRSECVCCLCVCMCCLRVCVCV